MLCLIESSIQCLYNLPLQSSTLHPLIRSGGGVVEGGSPDKNLGPQFLLLLLFGCYILLAEQCGQPPGWTFKQSRHRRSRDSELDLEKHSLSVPVAEEQCFASS